MKSSKTSNSKPGLEVCALATVFIYIAQTLETPAETAVLLL